MSIHILDWEANGKRLYIRDLVNQQDYREVEKIQMEAWGFSELDVVPSGQLIAAKAAGGVLLGAFDGERMIGFVYGHPGYEHKRVSLHSHMLAVKPEDRKLQAGAQLKLAQRLTALDQGIKEITWTFDPLQALNANLNFGRLGVVSDRYMVDFYGEETSSHLHRGVGTDRLWVRWLITSDRVRRRLNDGGNKAPSGVELTEEQLAEPGPSVFVRTKDGWEQVRDVAAHVNASECLIEIPDSITELKEKSMESARFWRNIVQNAFLVAFGSGYLAVECVKLGSSERPRWFYQLQKSKLENFENKLAL